MIRNRFVFLLASLMLLLLATPVARLVDARDGPSFARFVFGVAFIATLLVSILAVCRSRIPLVIFGFLTVVTVLLRAFQDQVDPDSIAAYSVGVCLLGYTVILIVRHLFQTAHVTFNTICASLCAFLLLGVLWALVYSLVDTLVPGSFTGVSEMRLDERDSLALYFSYVTLTTLGYGDISPVKDPARTLVFLEAITGQLYLVVLVARLVGLHIAHGTLQTLGEQDRNSDSSR